jgi:hypothetical protein
MMMMTTMMTVFLPSIPSPVVSHSIRSKMVQKALETDEFGGNGFEAAVAALADIEIICDVYFTMVRAIFFTLRFVFCYFLFSRTCSRHSSFLDVYDLHTSSIFDLFFFSNFYLRCNVNHTEGRHHF